MCWSSGNSSFTFPRSLSCQRPRGRDRGRGQPATSSCDTQPKDASLGPLQVNVPQGCGAAQLLLGMAWVRWLCPARWSLRGARARDGWRGHCLPPTSLTQHQLTAAQRAGGGGGTALQGVIGAFCWDPEPLLTQRHPPRGPLSPVTTESSTSCTYVCVSLSLVAKSCPTLGTPWAVAHQAPLSMGFSR